MRSYQPYPDYKDPCSKWIDKIPVHWKVVSLKHVLSIPITDGPHSTPEFLDEGIPFVSAEAVSSGHIDFSKIRGFISPEDDNQFGQKYSPKRNDVFMVKSGATTGVVAIVDTDKHFNIWSPLAVMRCKDQYNPYFLLNYLRSDSFQKSVQLSWTFGTQQNIGMGTLENLPVSYPPEDEQQKIADFLDHETAKIDSLIEKQQQLIALLKEKRQAVISHAVTKGLNPNAPMRDSGVEWLGEVPEHWIVVPLMAVADVVDPNPSHRNPVYTDEGYPFISTVEFVGIDDLEVNTPRRVAEVTVEEQEKRCNFKEGSLAFSRKGTIGDVRVLPHSIRFALLDSVCVINSGKKLHHEFLLQQIRSSVFESQLGLETRGAALPQISVGKVRNIKVLLPTVSEQLEIINYLRKQLAKLDESTLLSQKQITLLQERRSALISAAVTGKIDVRNWQPPKLADNQPDEATT
jgi:type I restriction enzyme S subunit